MQGPHGCLRGRAVQPRRRPVVALVTLTSNTLAGRHNIPDNPVRGEVSRPCKGDRKRIMELFGESPCERCPGRRRNSFTAKTVPLPGAIRGRRRAASRAVPLGPTPGSAGDVSEVGRATGRRSEAHLAEAPPSHTWRGFSLFTAPVCLRPQFVYGPSQFAGLVSLPLARSRAARRA
jgi:hypothetical protein